MAVVAYHTPEFRRELDAALDRVGNRSKPVFRQQLAAAFEPVKQPVAPLRLRRSADELMFALDELRGE